MEVSIQIKPLLIPLQSDNYFFLFVNAKTCVKEISNNCRKTKITKLQTEAISALEISKELCRDHLMIKKAVEKTSKLRTRSKEKSP